ncbi:DUF4240 domain-containing protein [Tenacibaculum amylolyticum]|uniref:DUF4240 domain-containing protein n=1 Tax=Tenacibaculum amylolyticum TaxID=104269 RepID=UPI0038933971
MDNLWLPISIALVLLAYHSINFFKEERESKELDEEILERRNKEFEAIKREQKIREDFTEFDEDDFWEVVDELRLKCKGKYANFYGLFKDHLYKLSNSELVRLHNLLIRLYRDQMNYDVLAAVAIIFKGIDDFRITLFLDVLISQGRVVFKHVSLNVELLLKKDIEEFNYPNKKLDLLEEAIQEVYFKRFEKLLPRIENKELIDIKGEVWEEKDLPIRYSKLLNKFVNS